MKHNLQRFYSYHAVTLARFICSCLWPVSVNDPSKGRTNASSNSPRHWSSWIVASVALLALQAGTASVATARSTGCDPQQFAGERHYGKVRMNGDRVASLHLIRSKDQQEIVTSYPYGRIAAIPTPDTEERCMKAKDLKTAGASASAAAGATTKFTQGLVIGWNPSTGRPLSPTACYNYTTSPLSGNSTSEAFSSQNSGKSVAKQTKVSATISGGFGAFSASGNFSYSDQWQSSSNSGSAYFNLSSIWNLSNTIDSTNPLTTQGSNLLDSGQFPTLCGVQYLASVTGGMVASVSIAYGSSSATTKSKMDAGLKVTYGLDSLKAGYEAAKSDTSSSSYIRGKLTIVGGGTATDGLLTAFNDVDDCNPGNPSSSSSACATFITGMLNAGSTALQTFNAQANSVTPGEDLSFITLFPYGIAGVNGTPGPASPPKKVTSGNDVLKPYTTQLTLYLTLLNQIATLYNRAQHLDSLIGTIYQPSSPVALDLTGYLDPLINTTPGAVSYYNNRQTLVADLQKCLKATKSNVTTVCAPIIDGGGTIDSAYAWYDAEHGYPDCTSGKHKKICWLAQQNTIALQYTGTLLIEGDISKVPHDVLYVDQLPPWSTSPIGKPIDGKAALVAFADREFVAVNKISFEAPNVSILPFKNDTDLKNIYTSVQPSATAFEWWGIDSGSHWYPQSGNQHGTLTTWTTQPCAPTFEEPCPIGFTWSWPEEVKLASQETVHQTTNPITGLFIAD